MTENGKPKGIPRTLSGISPLCGSSPWLRTKLEPAMRFSGIHVCVCVCFLKIPFYPFSRCFEERRTPSFFATIAMLLGKHPRISREMARLASRAFRESRAPT